MASCKGVPMERLTIPSQRRYLSYFSSVMEGVRYFFNLGGVRTPSWRS